MTRKKSKVSKAKRRKSWKRLKVAHAKKQSSECASAQNKTAQSRIKKAKQPMSEQLGLDQCHLLQDVSVRSVECHEIRQKSPLTISLKLDKVEFKPTSVTTCTSNLQQLKIPQCWYQTNRKDLNQADNSDSPNTPDESEQALTCPSEPSHTDEPPQGPEEGFDLAKRGFEDTDSAVLIDEEEDVAGYPLASTNKQKEARRLSRQKKIVEMKHRQMAEDRQMRLLRRQGLVLMRKKKSRKTVTWQKDSELVKIFSYST